MNKNIDFKEILNTVKHPEINNSLVELGMIGDIFTNEEGVVVVPLKLPFPNIPIKNLLIELIVNAITSKTDKKFGIQLLIMTDEEREHFMKLSQENWAL